MRRLGIAVVVAVVAGGCLPDSVALRYRIDEATTLTYDMTAVAHAEWDITTAGRGRGSYEVVYAVTETITPEGPGVATVSVVLDPREVVEDNLPSPGSDTRRFSLRIDESGEILEVVEVDGVPASELRTDELSFIGTYRPPLPDDPVKLRDRWRAEQEFEAASMFRQLVTVGSLSALDHDDGPVAHLRFSGDGPLVWTTALPQGEARLTGSAETRGVAVIDLEQGALRRGSSETRGRFTVRVVPSDDVSRPLAGILELEIAVSLART